MSTRVRSLALACAALAALLTTMTLVGWVTGSRTLTSIDPDFISMKLNTALCGLLLAVASATRRRSVVLGCAWVVLALVVITTTQYLLGVDLRIDQLIVADRFAGENPPGRMAPVTALGYFLLALALLGLAGGARGRTVHALCAVPFGAGFLAVLGYQFRTDQLYALANVNAVAVHTAVVLMLLAVAVSARVPVGPVTVLMDGVSPSARLVRRMAPVVVVLIPALATVDQQLMDSGVFGQRFGVALIAALGIVLIAVATGVAGRDLNASAARLLEANDQLAQLNATLAAGRDEEWERAQTLSDRLERERDDFGRILETIDESVWSVRIAEGQLETVYGGAPSTGLFGGPVPPDLEQLGALARQVHPDDLEALEDFRRAVLSGESADIEVRVVGLDGMQRWAWVRGTPRVVDGGTVFDGITSDITERRSVSEHREAALLLEMKQVEELRELARMRQDFVAVAGHEMRSPLAVIMGNAELLQDDGGLTVEQERRLGVIVTRAGQLSELVNDFFELARLESGVAEFSLTAIDLSGAAGDAVVAHLPSAEGAGLRLDTSLHEVVICADAPSVRRILDNLLSNALKYTPRGGWVKVTVRGEELYGVLDVADSGIGIPADEQSRVFDHLYRASSARARGLLGTGIGLAVTKALVDAQGGSIAVAAQPGGGTIFTVRLPRLAVDDC